MPYMNVRGIEVYYEEHGSGPHHVLMAHGLFGSVSLSTSCAADIAALGMHVISFDARGHGKSGYTGRREDYYRGALAEDLRGLLEALGLTKVSIFGTSMGAGTALMFAIAYPDSVTSLVLRSPPGFAGDAIPARRAMGQLAFLYRYFGSSATARIVAMIRGSRAGEMPAILRVQRAAAIVPAIRGLLIEGPPFPIEDLARITAPALILAHQQDPLHPLASGELLRDRLPRAELDVAADTDYWKRHPRELAQRVVDFAMSAIHATAKH
jgi:pimeloyl-ACP methyl ester carboxylesterase